MHFMPNNPTPLGKLPRRDRHRYPNMETKDTINLRYEGIDTWETHYYGKSQGDFAHTATTENLKLLGYSDENKKPQGYILTRLIDPYGRPVVFAFVGDPKENEEDGTRVKLDVQRMKSSVNFKLIQSGLAYPSFYSTLPDDLRGAIRDAVINDDSEFCPRDHTRSGVDWGGPGSISDLQPIFPKLWRRLRDYIRDRYFSEEADTLDAFIDYLRLQEERVHIVSQSRSTTLDEIVIVEGNTVRMELPPKDLVFT